MPQAARPVTERAKLCPMRDGVRLGLLPCPVACEGRGGLSNAGFLRLPVAALWRKHA